MLWTDGRKGGRETRLSLKQMNKWNGQSSYDQTHTAARDTEHGGSRVCASASINKGQCVCGAVALTWTVSQSPPPDCGQEREEQGRTQLPLSRWRPPRLLITRCPAPSLLPFLVLGGSKGNSRLFFCLFEITFSLTCVSKPSDREEKCWLRTLVRILPRWMQLGGG